VELIRALATVAEPPEDEHFRIAELLELGPVPEGAVYTDLFLFHLYPYASVYLSEDGMLGGEPADRIGGFWRALGHSPPAEPDHLAALLGLMASLEERIGAVEEAEALLLQNARRTLLREHLLPWLPVYLDAVEALAPEYYYAWARILRRVLLSRAQDALTQDNEQKESEFIHLECFRGPVDPRNEGGEPFLKALLAPARSGMILARADLGRAARELDLGFRLGERSYQLKALFGQDAGGVLEWLAVEARRWLERHRNRSVILAPVTGIWERNAKETVDLLEELAGERWDRWPDD